MSEPRADGVELPDAPDDLVTYPTDRVRALMDDAGAVAAAVDELAQSGFDDGEIAVLAGPQGAERLDATGRHHGLRGRLYRFVEHLGDEHGELMAASEHLTGGGLVILVPADDETKQAAARILKAHGGHRVVHFGKGHWESLG